MLGKIERIKLEGLVANNLRELISIVYDLYPTGKYYLWYRGHLDESWDLIPSVQRGTYCDNEQHMAIDFYMRVNVALKEKPPSKYYPGWVALMQHYGLPTRLLDWTKSLLVAAFFATYDYETLKDKEGCVWVFRPAQLNEIEGLGKCICAMDSQVIWDLLAPVFDSKDEKKEAHDKIYACYPVENNMRVYVQQSAFTVHNSKRRLQDIKSDQLLTKIIIPYEAKKIIIKELKICGITLKSIYPDAEHIAEEIKAFYNYGK